MSEKKRWQVFLWCCLYPGWLWVILLSLLSAAALVYIFTAQKEDTLLAYVVYAISFYALGLYYFILSLTKFLLLQHLGSDNLQIGLQKYRFCGGLLLLMGLAMTIVVWQMINGHDGRQYPGYLIYVVAPYAFYAFGNAIKNMIKCRKLYNPILSAAKMISFATAMVSMLSLQAAMFQSFGGTLSLRRTMSFWTGSAVCVFLFGMALYMIVHGNRQLQKIAVQQGTEPAVNNKKWGSM